uniref:Uncharacterized protein n=1 Tax=Brassica oleracea TaxID=3712 RepID=A0A3P6DY03_BRAOL|nr:unnamed protein product [Brassica oleracea]
MASEKFGPHLTTILDVKHIEAIYELWGVDYAVEIELPCDDETLETALAELGMAFAQMAPSFFHYKCLLLSGLSIIDGIPNRDDRWREKFFFFKINPASVGDFDFGRIPGEWSDEIGKFFFFEVNYALRLGHEGREHFSRFCR